MSPFLRPLLAALACAGLAPGVAAQESPARAVSGPDTRHGKRLRQGDRVRRRAAGL